MYLQSFIEVASTSFLNPRSFSPLRFQSLIELSEKPTAINDESGEKVEHGTLKDVTDFMWQISWVSCLCANPKWFTTRLWRDEIVCNMFVLFKLESKKESSGSVTECTGSVMARVYLLQAPTTPITNINLCSTNKFTTMHRGKSKHVAM